MLRSAICISGLARTYRKTHAAFIRNVVMPLTNSGPVDIFISTWDRVDLEALAPQWWGDKSGEALVDLNEMVRLYRPRALDVESYEGAKAGFALSRFTTNQCPIPEIVKNGVLLSIPAQYKVLRCNHLKRVAENLDRVQYDLVMRTRFDVEIEMLRPQEIDLDRVNCLWHRSDGMVCDYFYVGGSANMDKVADLYTNYPYLLNIAGSDMGPERNLHHHVAQVGVPTVELRDYNFALVRDSHRDEHIWNTTHPQYNANQRDRRVAS